MKRLINKHIGVVIALLISIRVVFQPYGADVGHIDCIIFNSMTYFFTACLLFYVAINHLEKNTKKISSITGIFFVILIITELYYINKPDIYFTQHRRTFWEGNLYILLLFLASYIIDKFTTLRKHGKMDTNKSGFGRSLFSNNRNDVN